MCLPNVVYKYLETLRNMCFRKLVGTNRRVVFSCSFKRVRFDFVGSMCVIANPVLSKDCPHPESDRESEKETEREIIDVYVYIYVYINTYKQVRPRNVGKR